MTRLIVFKEKHGDRHFGYNTRQDLLLTAEFIVRERHDEGWYEDEPKPHLLLEALKGNEAAMQFLNYRHDQGHEYEQFEIIEPETVEGVTL